MPFSLVASQPHYKDHLEPVVAALRDLPCEPTERINVLAGFSDVQRTPRQPFVYIEHGAGQAYDGVDPATPLIKLRATGNYSGGGGFQYAKGFLCPNQETADRWLARYPDKPAVAIGSPRLDPWHRGERGEYQPGTVAITFHWDAQFTGVPETTSAFREYSNDLLDIARKWRREGWHVLGHNHPRYSGLAQFWQSFDAREAGIEYVADAAHVLDRAEILVADNTSLQADFCSLGRRIVWVNHSAYRPSVWHGGRFWDWPQTLGGTQVQTPAQLRRLALDDVAPTTGHPYAFADGLAASRAATAVASWVSPSD